MGKYERCRCFSGLPYAKCCEPLHKGGAANNARSLMRSRYCAYAIGLPDYLMATTHKDNEEHVEDRTKWTEEIMAFTNGTEFTDLKIDDFVDGDDVAYVEFRASMRTNGQLNMLRERSKFVKEDGKWLYHSGEVSVPQQ